MFNNFERDTDPILGSGYRQGKSMERIPRMNPADVVRGGTPQAGVVSAWRSTRRNVRSK